MRVAVVLATFAGCGFAPQLGTDANGDGHPDVPDGIVPGDSLACYGTGLAKVCLEAAPPETFVVTSDTTIDTGDDGKCTQIVPQATSRELCVIEAKAITITAKLTATGKRPLVLLATGTLTVGAGGTIDVSSANAGVFGAGADADECVPQNPSPEGDSGGGGGGAGGSFGGKGGNGGVGDGNNNGGLDGTATPGGAPAAQIPTVVRGGCIGGTSGSADPMQPAGNPGANSGGAVYLIAGTSITVAGTLVASGAGGSASSVEFGGPGGGSGGLVGFDAPQITVTGVIAANGGGGGEGGTIPFNGGGGNPGEDGTASTTDAAAGGTLGTTDAGDGGDGSVGTTLDGDPGDQFFGGGGGGGGGAGYIYVKGALGGVGMFSPPPSS